MKNKRKTNTEKKEDNQPTCDPIVDPLQYFKKISHGYNIDV